MMVEIKQPPVVALAHDDEVPCLISLIAAECPDLPLDAAAIMELHRWSSNILTIKVDGKIIGGFAALFLNSEGTADMIQGTFPMTTPPPHLLAKRGEKVVAVYAWMHVARKCGTVTLPSILRWIWTRAPGANIYARPINQAAMRLQANAGAGPLFEGSPIWVRRHE